MDNKKLFELLHEHEHMDLPILIKSYIQDIQFALLMEQIFPDQVKEAGKHIARNLDSIEQVSNREQAIGYYTAKYGRWDPLRNNVETIDSIEEVRNYINKWNKKLSS